MNISLLEPIGISEERINAFADELRSGGHTFTYYPTKTSDVDELIARSKNQEIILIANNPYPAEVIQSNPALKMIAVAFTGVDHVDLTAAKEAGVIVTNCAGYSDQAVAELIIGLTLAIMRKIPQGDRVTRSGGTSAGLIGEEIAAKRVGIIGLGRIGRKTAELFSAFGAEVVTHSRTTKAGYTNLELEELLSTSDIITLHIPNIPETKGFLNKERLSLLKKDAILINCARGPIIDTIALSELLDSGKIRAGLDVFDMEPPLERDYPLVTADNTLLTPHVAFLTEEAMVRRSEILFENVRSYLEGTVINEVIL